MSFWKDITNGLEKIPVPVENLLDDTFPDEFQYSSSSIPSAKYSSEDFDIQYAGCSCQPTGLDCADNDCMCISIKSMGIDHYGPHRNILASIIADEIRQPPIFECNSYCTCLSFCRNRVVQFGLTRKLLVTKTKDTGWGLKVVEPTAIGQFVVEYAGEILDQDEARERTLAQSSDDRNYVHALSEHLGDDKPPVRTYVDPTHLGNVGRFINHSCEPNLVMIPVRIDNAVPRLALFAKRDIAAGEELSFHYSGGVPDSGVVATAVSESSLTSRKPCFCGAISCAGVLPFDSTVLF